MGQYEFELMKNCAREKQREADAKTAAEFIRANGRAYVSENGWFVNFDKMAADVERLIKEGKV